MPEVATESPAEIAARDAITAVHTCLDQGANFRLEAGAGAGKTYSLVSALRKLIDERGVRYAREQRQIACITYTNVAKDEIEQRTGGHRVIHTDTIHGFCWSLLRDYQSRMRLIVPEVEKWADRLDEVGGIGDRQVDYDHGFAGVEDDLVTVSHDDVLALMIKFLAIPKFRLLLAARYPVIFIDEYQDMNKDLAAAIVEHILPMEDGPLVGLFGDHWQRIYGDGCGLVEHEDLTPIGKMANFRSVNAVVEILNRMRPELPQAVSDPEASGEARLFHTNSWDGERMAGGHVKGDLPPDDARATLSQVREHLMAKGWEFDENKTKVLMLTHKILANEQGYAGIAAIFSRTDSFIKKEDPHIAFLVDRVEPACDAFLAGQFGAVFSLLGDRAPTIASHAQKRQWHDHLQAIAALRTDGSIGDVIDLIRSEGLIRLPSKVDARERELAAPIERDPEEAVPSWVERIPRLKALQYSEIRELAAYINGHTPFATKHGVKGAEFENVLVVVGRGWNQYNFDQMLGWTETGIPNGKEATFERSRNLFYVACSRPKKRLAVLFTQELSATSMTVAENLFGTSAVVDVASLS